MDGISDKEFHRPHYKAEKIRGEDLEAAEQEIWLDVVVPGNHEIRQHLKKEKKLFIGHCFLI